MIKRRLLYVCGVLCIVFLFCLGWNLHSGGPIHILNIRKGEVLTGDATLFVSLPEEVIEYGDVALYVDGEYGSVGGYVLDLDVVSAQATPLAKNFSRFLRRIGYQNLTTSLILNTKFYSNGQHYVKVVGPKGNSTSYLVEFKNPISLLQCDGLFDSSKGEKCHISAVCESPNCVVEITRGSYSPLLVRRYVCTSNKIDIAWDGRDELGKETSSDIYDINFKVGSTSYASEIVTKDGK